MSCGITFVEINGRAYVADVDPTSAAFASGIQPQDCVHYAAVLAKEWEEPLEGDFDTISKQALEREDKGQRITFNELQRVLLHGSGLLSSTNDIYMGPSVAGSHNKVPTTIRIGNCGPTTYEAEDYDDDKIDSNPQNNNKTEDPRPVVLVFRRTRQRPPRAWNVWPNFRLDDECDVAYSILGNLTTTVGGGGVASKKQPFNKTSCHRDNTLDASSSSTSDNMNVEASTIRGMISKAVGLAFVRSNKVVFGVSVHGGSGIVISRLSDGTWSAPSCIGIVGMGLGLQVGLEVANYIFILQTKEALGTFPTWWIIHVRCERRCCICRDGPRSRRCCKCFQCVMWYLIHSPTHQRR